MEKFFMCRICLREDIKLNSIVLTNLQEMYESLVLVPFETKDSRPILVCYLCCARLKNCYELRRTCIQSEELFTKILNCYELEPLKVQEIRKKKRLTIVHNVIELSVGYEHQMNVDDVSGVPFDDGNVEQYDQEDIDEDTLDENIVYDYVQSAASDNDHQMIVNQEQSGDRTGFLGDSASKQSEQAMHCDLESITSNNLNEHELVQDNSECKLESRISLCSDVRKEDLSHETSTRSHTRTDQQSHQCVVCKKRFAYMSQLTYHIRIHTGEKPYQCNECKKCFTHASHLTLHMRTHTGEKPYHCDVCKKQFISNGCLTKHMRTHTGEKPYQCSLCKKCYSQASHLAFHMRTHSGERPYRCDICNKEFLKKKTLTTHMRTHAVENNVSVINLRNITHKLII